MIRWRCASAGAIGCLFTTLLTCCFLSGCRDADQPHVVLYVSADEHIARQVIDAFEQETGIRVDFIGDSEVKKTTGLVERLRAEKNRPRADVFWSSEIFMTIELAEEGLFEQHVSDTTRDWPKNLRDPDHLWHGFASRARVIVYAPDRVPDDQLPETWMHLTRDWYRDRIAMADPRFGTTGGHLGVMKSHWSRTMGSGFYQAFLEGLADNHVRLLPGGNAAVVRAVASGEADLGLTDTDDVWAAQANGLKVDLIYPRHCLRQRGCGTLLIPNTAARVEGGPNPSEAAKFIDFLLSEQVERMLAESDSHNIPSRSALATEYGEYIVDDPLILNYTAAAHQRKQAIAEAMEYLVGNPNGSSSDAR